MLGWYQVPHRTISVDAETDVSALAPVRHRRQSHLLRSSRRGRTCAVLDQERCSDSDRMSGHVKQYAQRTQISCPAIHNSATKQSRTLSRSYYQRRWHGKVGLPISDKGSAWSIHDYNLDRRIRHNCSGKRVGLSDTRSALHQRSCLRQAIQICRRLLLSEHRTRDFGDES